jgi:nickel-dependent lactate racemase
MKTIELKYGTISISCKLLGAHILQAEQLPQVAAAEQLINEALANPIGTLTLEKIIQPGEKVAIVTSDITRYSGSEIYLPILIAELNNIGIPDSDIEIIIALGIHRQQTAKEHQKILGSLSGRIAVYDHECDDPEELVDLGMTDSGKKQP